MKQPPTQGTVPLTNEICSNHIAMGIILRLSSRPGDFYDAIFEKLFSKWLYGWL